MTAPYDRFNEYIILILFRFRRLIIDRFEMNATSFQVSRTNVAFFEALGVNIMSSFYKGNDVSPAIDVPSKLHSIE